MKFVIIGHGGHSKVISDLVLARKENDIVAYLDDKFKEFKMQGNIFYGPIMSVKKMIEYFNDLQIIIAIGNNLTRKMIVRKLNIPEEMYGTLVHTSAVVSPSATIGKGTVIMPHAVVNADAQIGKHAIINTGSVVEHDCKIEDFVHISPHASLTGGVQIKEGASVGSGSAIIPNSIVGEWSVIGAGATVISDIPSHSTAVGTPAKVKNKMEVN
jgi:acetyltransferase EpsM